MSVSSKANKHIHNTQAKAKAPVNRQRIFNTHTHTYTCAYAAKADVSDTFEPSALAIWLYNICVVQMAYTYMITYNI